MNAEKELNIHCDSADGEVLTAQKTKISVFTLGCKTNLYESLQIVADLKNNGHNASHGLKQADVFVLNTCAVTSEAEKKSRQAVARAKKLNPDCRIIVVGCASQKSREQFLDLENIVCVKGNSDKEKLAEILKNLPSETSVDNGLELPKTYIHSVDATQQKTRAFLKIQDGCNNFCSYCIIPYLRGRSRSKEIADILREATSALAQELVLVGIDISQFGRDNGQSLAKLLNTLKETGKRVRLGSLECRAVTDEFLNAANFPNFCPHFHLSLQSGSDSVLKRMNRKYSTAEYFETVQKIKKIFPNAAITTDIIVGFSGETDAEFLETCDFVKRCRFADIHIFPYSRRQGSAAYSLPDVDAETKSRRTEILGSIKSELRDGFLESQLGSKCEVLIEQKKNGFFEGYTKNYTRVYLKGDLKANDIVKTKLKAKFKNGFEGEVLI